MTATVKVTQSDPSPAPGEARGAYAPRVPGGPSAYEQWSAANVRYLTARAAVLAARAEHAKARAALAAALDEYDQATLNMHHYESAPGIPLYTEEPGYDPAADPRLTETADV
jgi:hypothetical protein